MIAHDHLAELDRYAEVAPLGGAAIERERGLGHRQRVAEMGVVVAGAGMAEAAVGCAALGQRPIEGADGGVDQRLLAVTS